MVKKFIRSIIIICLSIYLTDQLWQNINYSQKLNIILLASLVLTIFEFILKPILKLLLLPITILTLGLLKLVINTLGLYIAQYFIDGFNVGNISFISKTFLGVRLPDIRLNNFFAYLITSLTINIVYNWLSQILIKIKKIKI